MDNAAIEMGTVHRQDQDAAFACDALGSATSKRCRPSLWNPRCNKWDFMMALNCLLPTQLFLSTKTTPHARFHFQGGLASSAL